MKFGGTSVGSVESILNVKKIVESQTEPVIVVVSALGGITDSLIRASSMAKEGNPSYHKVFGEIVERHEQMINSIIPHGKDRDELLSVVRALLEELRSIYQGVYLIRDLTPKTLAAIVSYGERISSRIVATLIDDVEWYDSRDFIKTEVKGGQNRLATELTYSLVRDNWKAFPKVSLVGGFISTDATSGEVTNLGRGGSDYTASIIAAALDASVLEIWTDVDGFMTADPRVISSAYVIPELSYIEAMELCNFGAKVVYPPTIYPVCIKHIPILIKNTFNPDAPGSIIKDEVVDDVLLTLVRKLPVYRYDPDVNGHFRNFLIGIVNNKAREYKRKRMREAEKRDAYEAEARLSWEHERQSYAVDLRNWTKDASEVALTQFMADPKVSTRDKEIFRLIVLCGQSPDEVAALFGIERNNVDQIKSRMRKKLMELVEQYRQVGCEEEK